MEALSHEATNLGTDRSQLSPVAKAAKGTLNVEKLDAYASSRTKDNITSTIVGSGRCG
jgi:hypothetical protein